ncbi:hypothetical protein OSG_eHP27_00125 [environmental Halophage eHP-27]|nr:hypothetical protein OSG_eHP27_00125 [environmental Halophage eHP-27]
MGDWQPAIGRRRIALLVIGLGLVVGAGVALALPTAAGSASLEMDGLSVAGTNETVSGNVSDVQLQTTLTYSHDVPDAERRIVRLKVGPTADDLTLLDYQQTRDPTGTASGTVELAGSVLDHPSWTAKTFDPGLANTTSQEVVVQAVVEVQRAGGDAVTHTVTDTATVTLTDDAELTATISGDGSLTVQYG